jgi:MFS superfamily sulfate permease-like transporter
MSLGSEQEPNIHSTKMNDRLSSDISQSNSIDILSTNSADAVDDEKDVSNHGMVLPSMSQRILLYRHRTPSSVGTGSAQHALLIRQEIDRIRKDITNQTRHAVPVPDMPERRHILSSRIQETDEKVQLDDLESNALAVNAQAENAEAPTANEPPPLSKKEKRQIRFNKTKKVLVNYVKQSKPFRTCNSFSTPYTLRALGRDVIAGTTVAIMEVPLSMSYAKLAGLPAYFGLYACFIPPIIYPLLGTSRQLSVGPAALVSLIVSAGISKVVAEEGLVDINSEEYITRYTQLAIQCAFLSGVVNMGMGLLRLGFITQFLSKALISGFTSGAAILISFSQLKHLFGYSIPTSNTIQGIIAHLVEDIDQFNWKTFVMGIGCLEFILVLKSMSSNERLNERFSWTRWLGALSPILTTIVMIILSYTLDFDTHSIPIVGEIPPGLPPVTITWWTSLSHELVVVTISSVIISFVQSIAVTKRIAYKRGYEVDSSQELVSIGLANIIGSMFGSYPTTGAIAQSAVADEVGAETGFASVITGVVVMIVLLLLTSVFEYMPLAVLAAIVIAFVSSMFDYKEAKVTCLYSS